MSDLIRKMVKAFVAHNWEVFSLSGKVDDATNEDAMRAALRTLADNVTDEMKSAFTEQWHKGTTVADAIAAAIREAAR